MLINKEELLEMIERKYGDLENNRGCYVHNGEDYEWLSIADIVDIINDCEEYDEDDEDDFNW